MYTLDHKGTWKKKTTQSINVASTDYLPVWRVYMVLCSAINDNDDKKVTWRMKSFCSGIY